jgi:hypothetical protein
MNAARHVIGKFGGQSELARMIGKGPSTVQHWASTGVIPARWHNNLLQLAAEHGVDLSPNDLVNPPDVLDHEVQAPIPEAKWPGELVIGDVTLPVYVLDNGQRVLSRTGATSALIGPQGGGNLESYIGVQAVREYMPPDLSMQMVEFLMPGVVNKTVLGMDAETFLDICRAYVSARDERALKTETQEKIAIRAGAFLAACAKVGLIALIDEATGYQYERAENALQLNLRLFLAEEMRKWEKTFPDELWREFGRLTNWRGQLHQRPKYWGHLVMELVYGYLDSDVADWLKKNNPKPVHRQNYHQWLSSQYGLRRLLEHIWMLVGMGSACQNMAELRRKMAEKYGRTPVQMIMYLPPRALEEGHPKPPGYQRRAVSVEKHPELPLPDAND